MAMIEDQVAKF